MIRPQHKLTPTASYRLVDSFHTEKILSAYRTFADVSSVDTDVFFDFMTTPSQERQAFVKYVGVQLSVDGGVGILTLNNPTNG